MGEGSAAPGPRVPPGASAPRYDHRKRTPRASIGPRGPSLRSGFARPTNSPDCLCRWVVCTLVVRSVQVRLRTFTVASPDDSGRTPGEARFFVRLASDHITKRAVVADPNLTLIRAEAPGTADLGGIAPNDLCVVAADLPLPTGIFSVVIRRTLCGPVGYDVILTDPLTLATAIAPGEGTRPVEVLPRTAMCHDTAVVLRQMDRPTSRGFRQWLRPPQGTDFNDGADPVVRVQHPLRVQIRCCAPARRESQADRHQDPGSRCKAGFQSRFHFRVTPCFVGFMERRLRKDQDRRRVVRHPHRVSASPDAEGHSVERNATMH